MTENLIHYATTAIEFGSVMFIILLSHTIFLEIHEFEDSY
jgi:hypothetical protein